VRGWMNGWVSLDWVGAGVRGHVVGPPGGWVGGWEGASNLYV